jgi:hypothetical protein
MDVAELDRRLTRLEGIEAISRLTARYCEICDDSHNPDRMVELFTEDGTWEGNGFMATGRHDLHPLFKTFGTMVTETQHTAVNPTIDVEGDRAEAIWINVGFFLIRETGQWQLMTARYAAECARVGGRWLFRHVRVERRLSVELSPGRFGASSPEWVDQH